MSFSIAFIESSCPAFLSEYSEASLFIYTRISNQYSKSGQKKIVVPVFLLRFVKVLCALLRFNCIFQGGDGIAFKLSKQKWVISDGILTEFLNDEGYIKPEKFISVRNIRPSLKVNSGMQLILGNNWFEFGIFSKQKYEDYLRQLKNTYPDAYYYPHPKEKSSVLKKIFGYKLLQIDGNIETYCLKNGIPFHIIGFLGSTAMVTLAKLALSNIVLESLRLRPEDCDGPAGEVTDPYLLNHKGIKVTLWALEETVRKIISEMGNVTLKESYLWRNQ